MQPEVAKFTRILSYDRAGYGWSDLSSQPRTAEQAVSELRQLLKEAEIEPPYVLVGMSFSGLFTRLFAYNYPENESPQGVHIIADKSGHVIQLDDPELVIDVIRQVVEKVRCHSFP